MNATDNRSSSHRDRGSVSVAAVLLMVIVFAGGGLIFDGARYLAAERHASNAAEGAARAAVATGSPSTGLSAIAARQAAIEHAGLMGIPATDIAVSFPDARSVVVTITERRTAVFSRFAGSSTLTVQATGQGFVGYE
jgi:Flp pilus assembly protein TadG